MHFWNRLPNSWIHVYKQCFWYFRQKIVHPSHADHSRERAAVESSQKYSTSWIQHIQFQNESMLSAFSRRKSGHRDFADHIWLNQIKISESQNPESRIFTDSRFTQLEGVLISMAKKWVVFEAGVGPYHPYTIMGTRPSSIMHTRMLYRKAVAP